MKAKLITILFLCLGFYARAQEYPIGQYYERKLMRAWHHDPMGGFYVAPNRIFLLLNDHNPDSSWSSRTFNHNDSFELVALTREGEVVNRVMTSMTDSMSTRTRLKPWQYIFGREGYDELVLGYWQDIAEDSAGNPIRKPKLEVFDGHLNQTAEWLVQPYAIRPLVHFEETGKVTVMACCSTVLQYDTKGQVLADSVPFEISNDRAEELHQLGDSLYTIVGGRLNVLDAEYRIQRSMYIGYPYTYYIRGERVSALCSDSAIVFDFEIYDSTRPDKAFDAICKLSFDGQRRWVHPLNGSGPAGLTRVNDVAGMHSGQVALATWSDEGTQLAFLDRAGTVTLTKRFTHKYDKGSGSHRQIVFTKIEYDDSDSSIWTLGLVLSDQNDSYAPDSLQYRSVFVLHLDQYGNPVEEDPNLIVEDVYSSVGVVASHRLRCYPNPAQDVLHIQWQGEAAPGASYQLFTTTGQLVQQGAVRPPAVIPVAALPEGLYLLRMASASDNKSYYARFVKQ